MLRIQRLLRDEKYTIEGARAALGRELAAPGGAAAPTEAVVAAAFVAEAPVAEAAPAVKRTRLARAHARIDDERDTPGRLEIRRIQPQSDAVTFQQRVGNHALYLGARRNAASA